jgi:hypothetical protein
VPYPNIFALHELSEELTTVTVAGPLEDIEPKPDAKATVFAVVTQVPGEDRTPPTELKAAEPLKAARAWGQSFYPVSGAYWHLDLTGADERKFAEGWAFVQAAVVTFSPAGQLVTYTWSRWSYLTTKCLHLEAFTG